MAASPAPIATEAVVPVWAKVRFSAGSVVACVCVFAVRVAGFCGVAGAGPGIAVPVTAPEGPAAVST